MVRAINSKKMSHARLFAGLSCLSYLVACGGAKFGGGKPGNLDALPQVSASISAAPTPSDSLVVVPSSPVPAPSDINTVPPGEHAASLTWFFQCDSAPGQVPVGQTNHDLVAVGAGNHAFPADVIDEVPVTLTGKLCPAATKRDIVIIIDVSGSMGNTDRNIGGDCNRRKAINAIAAAASPGSDVRFAAITFSTDVVAASSGFKRKIEDVFDGQDLGDVACAIEDDTNYTKAFRASQNYFAASLADTSRIGASREVYFITDGVPSIFHGIDIFHSPDIDNPEVNGSVEAANLKSKGVSIATVLIGNSSAGSDYLEHKIASSPSMHQNIINVETLADRVALIVANDLASGQIMYRPVNSTSDWTKFDMLTVRHGDNFVLPPFVLDTNAAPQGMQVHFVYQDKHGKNYSGDGILGYK